MRQRGDVLTRLWAGSRWVNRRLWGEDASLPKRRQLLEAARHVLCGRPVGPHKYAEEYLVCSCGWISPEPVCWHDDVVITDLNKNWKHATDYVLIYTPGHDMTTGGIVVSTNGGRPKRIPNADLMWLATQDDVPAVIREALSGDANDDARN